MMLRLPNRLSSIHSDEAIQILKAHFLQSIELRSWFARELPVSVHTNLLITSDKTLP